jgi:hypothetical protein
MNHKELTDILNEIDRDGLFLTDWEVDFIGDLIDRPRSSFSEKQEDKILKIYNERCR